MTTTVNTINGNEGNNRLTGTSRNDVINGNGGNDKLSGGSGDDTLNGGAGKDELNGGSGNDVLDGGSGSDELEGGSGNDRLIYTLAENNVIGKFTYDEYEGGSGTDTLELRFTRAEWMNTNNQTVLQNYINWASKSGSGCRWDDDFTFRFGNAKLEIEDIEKLVVKVDGTEIKDVGKNTVIAVVDSIGISEDNTGEEIYVLGNDKVNYLVKDLKLERAPLLGTVTLIKPTLQNGSIDENANNWYFKYSPDNAYQYLKEGEPAIESFTYKVTDAKGASATGTVNINITGVNDKAEITFATPDQLIEDSNFDPTNIAVESSSEVIKLISNGTIKIADIDKSESKLLRIDPFINNIGDIDSQSLIQLDPISGEIVRSDVRYLYTIENSKVQFLGEGKTHIDYFYVRSIDGTSETISFTTTGVNDAAVIGDPSNNQVTEDAGDIVDGFITLTGEISIADADNGEAFFQTDVIALSTNKGTLDLNSFGSYTYKVKNADIQSLNTGDRSRDEFKIYAKDGTEQTIVITINGANDIVNSAPVVKELGQGENKYAGSANVEELINLKYDNPTIAKYVAKGGDYDYLHVRTGQFTFSDADFADKDKFTITSKAASLEGNLGTLTFDKYTNAKDSSGNIIDGEYIVKWTYTVKDRDLESLNTPTAGSSSKDDDFIVTINDGTTTIDTKIMLNLFGRNEIEFVDGLNGGNNVYDAKDEPFIDRSISGNDVLYFGDTNDNAFNGDESTQVVYGNNGNDQLYIRNPFTVFFSGDGDDSLFAELEFSNGLFFGGNGNDSFRFGLDNSIEGRKNYIWGGAGSDFFELYGKSSKSIDWVMDFDSRKPIDGGDQINFFLGATDFNWAVSGTNLEKKSADAKHPFLSEGAEYYDLQINRGADLNNPIWFSILNLVGVDGTEITLQRLIDNGNLV